MTGSSIRLVVGLLFVLAGFSACGKDRKFDDTPMGEAGAPASTGGTSGGPGVGTAGSDGDGECTFGATRCDGLAPQTCSEDGAWVNSQASCAIACFNGECGSCAEGAKTCKDGAVQKCVDGNWATEKVCDKFCEASACVDTCTEGLQQCNGAKSLQKCAAGAFVDDTTCEFLCSDGACAGTCTPDTTRCNPDAPNDSQVCNGQGEWGDSTACAEGTFCVAGKCAACQPDSLRCSDTMVPQACSPTGEWVNQEACTEPTAACAEGKCVTCEPGSKRCTGQNLEECAADGSTWTVKTTCSGDTPACLTKSKTCGKCAEGDKQCFGNDVQVCDAQSTFQTAKKCSGSTPRCTAGECSECNPSANERRCATSTSAQACGTNGAWAAATACTGDTPLCREDLGFKCGCKEGEIRCRNTTVPEKCQGGAWVAQTACSGTLDYCLPATGACVDCVPKKAECVGGVAHQCNDAGAFVSLNSCSGPGINCGNCGLGDACSKASECTSGICVNSKCAVCTPGTRSCVGATPRVCSTSGTWTNETSCSGSTPQCLASTGQCVACTGTEKRSCGSCNTGTQTCSNNAWGSCTGAVDLKTSEQFCGSCNVSCSGTQECNNGSCTCASGSHACGSGSTCYSNTDADHCGSSCFDCSAYHGTMGSCGSNQCTCESSSALACNANVPTCGVWDFDSGKVDAWHYGNYYLPDNHHWVGNITTAQINGSPAVTAEYNGISESGSIELEVDLCPNGTKLDLSKYNLSYDYYLKTTAGTPFTGGGEFGDGNDSFLTSGGLVILSCQPFADPSSDTWETGRCSNLPASLTTLNIIFRLTAGWAGKVYIDNVKFTPK